MELTFPYPDRINILLEKQGSTNNYNYHSSNFNPSSLDVSIISSRADEIVLLDMVYKRVKNICFETDGKTLLRLIYEKQEDSLKNNFKNL